MKHGELEAKVRVRVVPTLPIEVDFESFEGNPPGWISATPAKFRVVERDGTKALMKLADQPRFLLANAYFGHSTWTDYTVQADVLGTERRRQLPNIGILNTRYELVLMGNTGRLRLVSWAPMPRIEKQVKYAWDPDKWYSIKLRVERVGTEGLVRGKVWPRDSEEPEEWTVEIRDPSPNLEGSPGILGYSAGTTDRSKGTEIYWDNFNVTPNR